MVKSKHMSYSSLNSGKDDDEVPQYLQLHQMVVRKIGEIFRVVNQRLLLQDLHDRHVCNSLLVAESEEDTYRKQTATADDYSADESYQPRDYLAATMQVTLPVRMCGAPSFTFIHDSKWAPTWASVEAVGNGAQWEVFRVGWQPPTFVLLAGSDTQPGAPLLGRSLVLPILPGDDLPQECEGVQARGTGVQTHPADGARSGAGWTRDHRRAVEGSTKAFGRGDA